MTPHPHPHRLDARRATPSGPRRARRTIGTTVGCLLAALIASPTAVHASTDGNERPLIVESATVVAVGREVAAAVRDRSDVADAAAAMAAPPPAVDPVQATLLDTYQWDERGPRVEALQHLIGVSVDGWYGLRTRQAHLNALLALGLPSDTVPAVVLSPGPDPDRWEALRRCESGGDYSITSRSGTYRGAYQFDRSTWDSVASRHDPSLVGLDPAAASPQQQDAMAQALYSERGARPWPQCGRHLRTG